jgi:hypothetical protein
MSESSHRQLRIRNKLAMRFRKLRIAWAVFWGLACVLLIVLWVRSYQVWDSPFGPLLKRWELQFNSVRGYLLTGIRFAPSNASHEWKWRTFHADRFTDQQISGSIVWKFNRSISALGFGAVQTNQSWHVYVPYWALALCAVGASLLPIHWFARFNLRTLLIATTLVAVVLGAAVYVSN